MIPKTKDVISFDERSIPVLKDLLDKIYRTALPDSQGVTADVAVAKVGGGTRTLHYSQGLYVGYTDS